MNPFPLSPRRRAVLLALSCTICLLSGCAVKPAAGPPVEPSSLGEPVIKNSQTLTPAEKAEQREKVVDYIQKLTPQQGTAYFKAHPEAVQALKP